MTFVDVLIIGAGAAGLAAATHLRAAGRTTLILEAAPRPGGRARTARPDVLRGDWLDEGAAWLHMADQNPLVHLAQARGVALREAFGNPSRMFLGGREGNTADHQAYEAAEAAWFGHVTGYPTSPDAPLAQAIGAFRHENAFAPTIEAWEASLIEAADAETLSLADFRLNQIDGINMMAEQGLGQLLLDMLIPGAGDIRLNCPALRVDWSGQRVRVETPQGVVEAGAVIVTVSVGVLAAGHIGFAPALPGPTAQAIADLPMGLLSKIVLRTAGGDRLGMTGPTQLFRCLDKLGDPFLSFIAWPRDSDHVIGFCGGKTAWDLSGDAAAALDFARGQWRGMLGAEADRIFAEGGIVTDWGADPHHLGAYTYARPGATGARATLAEPLAGGRLIFAGEACRTDGMAGTVGGAMLDGGRAAEIVLKRGKPGHA